MERYSRGEVLPRSPIRAVFTLMAGFVTRVVPSSTHHKPLGDADQAFRTLAGSGTELKVEELAGTKKNVEKQKIMLPNN